MRLLGDVAFQVETRRRAYRIRQTDVLAKRGAAVPRSVQSGALGERNRPALAPSRRFAGPRQQPSTPRSRLRRPLMIDFADRIGLAHLDRMTDSTGLIQHAIYSVPRRESGYTTDDNARALRLCVRLWSQHPDDRMLGRVTTYLSFLEYAHCLVRGFHNFLSYQREWLDAQGTGDSQGQAVRALAEVLGSPLPSGYRALARELIEEVLPALADLRSLRTQAYIILAWAHLWASDVEGIEPLESLAWSAAHRLVECYRRSERPDWLWFESRMTYANAVLPRALFVACAALAGGVVSRRGRGIVRVSRPCDHRRKYFLARRKQRMVSPRRREVALRSATGRGGHDGRGRAGRAASVGRRKVPRHVSPYLRLVSWRQQLGPAVGRRPLRRLLRRPASRRPESQPGRRIRHWPTCGPNCATLNSNGSFPKTVIRRPPGRDSARSCAANVGVAVKLPPQHELR